MSSAPKKDPPTLPKKDDAAHKLQLQIQKQLQEQLTAQLQAAAMKGQAAGSAAISTEQIQAQAQAMVQAAAQAQAVVAAARAKGDLTPMNAQQVAALSQVQAQAIVNARPKKPGESFTPSQIQHQINLQAQALVHAHTQAQIQAGIFKGDESAKTKALAAKPSGLAFPFKRSADQMQAESNLSQKQKKIKTDLEDKHQAQLNEINEQFKKQNAQKAPTEEESKAQKQKIEETQARHKRELVQQQEQFKQEVENLQKNFRAAMPPQPRPNLMPPGLMHSYGAAEEDNGVSELDPVQFAAHMDGLLTKFWESQRVEMEKLPIGTEQDFKTHNDLPLARIKRIMKSDEDVRMISAEAPVLFAKACEMFILEMTLRGWCYSEQSKRRTLQKEDIQTAIRKTDIFDFLVDVINNQ